jgi:hypothetical protein
MKRTIKLLALAGVVAVFAVSAVAQSKECNDENKGAWYKTFYDNFRGTAEQQKTAVEAARTYLGACPADPNDKQADYMKKFVDKYDALMGKNEIAKQFQDAVTAKKYAEEIRIGKQILATDPDNVLITIILGGAGLGDANVLPDSAQYAKKSIELIEAGKPFAPYTSKDQALAYLNYVLAKNAAKSNDPNAAITYFIKSAKYESDLKKNALLYNELAAAYGAGPVGKLAEDYKAYIGKPETTESKLVLANLNQAIDRQIDAFARAAALSTNPADKKAVMDVLTEIAKSRNQTDADVNTLVANVLSKPVPEPPTPITTLPSTPGSTPGTSSNGGSGAGNSTANNGGVSNTAKPTTTTTSPSTAGSAKPSASPTPMNKKPLKFRR